MNFQILDRYILDNSTLYDSPFMEHDALRLEELQGKTKLSSLEKLELETLIDLKDGLTHQ